MIQLVAINFGTSKEGKSWCRVTLKKKGERGTVVREFFIPPDAGRDAIARGVQEDDEVMVVCGLDEFLRPGIIQILPSEEGENIL